MRIDQFSRPVFREGMKGHVCCTARGQVDGTVPNLDDLALFVKRRTGQKSRPNFALLNPVKFRGLVKYLGQFLSSAEDQALLVLFDRGGSGPRTGSPVKEYSSPSVGLMMTTQPTVDGYHVYTYYFAGVDTSPK